MSVQYTVAVSPEDGHIRSIVLPGDTMVAPTIYIEHCTSNNIFAAPQYGGKVVFPVV